MNNPEGAWIFVSHSTKDWEKVRRVRNLLEEKGHRPLLFFLKCVEDESELDDLLKREIEVRTWFLLCDSENARKSKWVQAEVAYIKELDDKLHEAIDLQAPIEGQVEKIDRLCKRVTVFLSYARKDHDIADRIRRYLRDHDYSVWFDSSVASGNNFLQDITRAIDQAVERGFVLVLLSSNSMESKWVQREVQYSLEKASKAPHGGNIIPLMIDDPATMKAAMPASMQFALSGIQWIDISKGDFNTNMENLVRYMRTCTME